MKLTAAILLSFAAGSTIAIKAPRAHELTAEYSYDEWCQHFNTQPSEEGRGHFVKNLAAILEHNAKPGVSYKKGVNQFTALPPNTLPTSKGRSTAARKLVALEPTPFDESLLDLELPDFVDWRQKGVVSPVKNQGHCGSCWAFATTATVESHVALNSGNLFSLSPQQLVACAPNDDKCGGVGGCMGSIPELAYDYLVSAGGMAEEWSYPYVSYSGETNGTCSEPEVKITIDGYVKLPENNATAVMAALAHVGPLAINIDASVWSSYESGVFDGCSYTDMEIDHVVELVGYGTDKKTGMDYWLVRNSWSPTFGENGYIRLKRDPVDATPCGVDDQPTMGTGCEGPGGDTRAVQYPCGQCGAVFDVSYPTGADTA